MSLVEQELECSGSQLVVMQNEIREKHRRTATNLRRSKDLTMAILILGMAIVLFFSDKLGLRLSLGDNFRIALGALFALYGIFRLYRGIKGE